MPLAKDCGKVLIDFSFKQVQSCTFPFLVIAMLAATKFLPSGPIPRYDLLLLGCILLQLLMVWWKLESWRDVGVVSLFHLLGLGLEIYKVNSGAWSYPEFSYLKVNGAPVYAGFMYAGVASYMCLAWKRLELRCSCWPPAWIALPIAVLIYGQFFFGGWTIEHRLLMLALVVTCFWKTRVWFTSGGMRLHMPMPVSFMLIGTMIWVAENLATYFGAWQYPYQADAWVMVHWTKIVSWTLLMGVSLIIVAEYKRRLGHLVSTQPELVKAST